MHAKAAADLGQFIFKIMVVLFGILVAILIGYGIYYFCEWSGRMKHFQRAWRKIALPFRQRKLNRLSNVYWVNRHNDMIEKASPERFMELLKQQRNYLKNDLWVLEEIGLELDIYQCRKGKGKMYLELDKHERSTYTVFQYDSSKKKSVRDHGAGWEIERLWDGKFYLSDRFSSSHGPSYPFEKIEEAMSVIANHDCLYAYKLDLAKQTVKTG